ncbi:unnamed protein product [Prorocentrum cordatum]|uniref:PsbP C-terminal domain-containing protein n=1 Tax=Prorocentrum cordatum TaxID=2364126 RepID=A0ABN9UDV1_9DINO|nr:unnamed protein product [Polarella glacialis]
MAGQQPARAALLGALGAAAASPSLPALAFETYKDPSGAWEFKYATGLQKSESKLWSYFLRDLIEPLESVGVRVSETKRKSLDEIGDATEVGKRLLADSVPNGAPSEIISATTQYDREGRRQDIIEYAYQWKFDDNMAKQLGRKRFQLHNKALVMIERKKQFLVQASVEEPRWAISGDLLCTALDTFKLNA